MKSRTNPSEPNTVKSFEMQSLPGIYPKRTQDGYPPCFVYLTGAKGLFFERRIDAGTAPVNENQRSVFKPAAGTKTKPSEPKGVKPRGFKGLGQIQRKANPTVLSGLFSVASIEKWAFFRKTYVVRVYEASGGQSPKPRGAGSGGWGGGPGKFSRAATAMS